MFIQAKSEAKPTKWSLGDYKCTKDAACCKGLGDEHILWRSIAGHEVLVTPVNGVCNFLKDNRCIIYDERPVICAQWCGENANGTVCDCAEKGQTQ